MFKSRPSLIIVLTFVILSRSADAVAGINSVIHSGNWETASNWSLGTVPVSTDNVIVPPGFTIAATVAGDVCNNLTIAATASGFVTGTLTIGGNLANAGTFNTYAGATLTFNGTSTSTISGGGIYSIASTLAMNMVSTATVLDVQDGNFILGINSGAKYYFSFMRGTWKMDNTSTLGDAYNSGSATALTIPYGVVIEADNGQMNLAKKGANGSVILSGEIFLNGGNVFIQTGQTTNTGNDFRYTVNGGTPQLYIASGTLSVGAGFNALNASDYIDFHMTGGTMVVAVNGYSNWMTFQLADNVGGKTFMSGGLIVLQDACNAAIADLDMGGANVAATQYSVTGGTVQLGYVSTQAGATFFAINAQPATNYPNINFQSGASKTVSAWANGTINMLSLHINANMTFNATGFPLTNIISNNGTYAYDAEGAFTPGTNTVQFSGSVPQLITTTSLASETFYNLQIANTSGNVILGLPTIVSNKLGFTSGYLDASNKTLTLSNGAIAVTGASQTSNVIVGNGISTLGYMTINNLPKNTNTFFPISTGTTYYLPMAVNPGNNASTSYSAYVFTGATLNAKQNGTPMSATTLANMLNAIWNVTRTAGAGTAALTLNWTPAETALQGSTFSSAGTSIGIAQYVGAGGWLVGTGSGNVATQTATSSFTSFTQFAVVDNLFVLPITVSDFNAALNDNKTVSLSWNASEGMGITQFDVQRSTDGTNFTTLGTVDAVNDETNYSFADPSPVSSANYYRLLIHGNNGATSYSGIRTISLAPAAGIAIYPVPATTTVNVSVGNAGTGTAVRLISVTGQVLQSSVTTGNNQIITLDISRYPSGAYFVQVIGENRTLQMTTVTKL